MASPVPIERIQPIPPDMNASRIYPGFGAPAGSVAAGATVQVTDLDSDADPVQAVAKADGSFALDVPAMPGDELRFEVLLDDARRSVPADAVLQDDYSLVASRRLDCLALNPGFLLRGSPNATVTLNLENGCGADVTFESARFRVTPADFNLVTTLPLTLATTESGALAIGVNGAATRENVLLIDVTSAGTTLRYAITITP